MIKVYVMITALLHHMDKSYENVLAMSIIYYSADMDPDDLVRMERQLDRSKGEVQRCNYNLGVSTTVDLSLAR